MNTPQLARQLLSLESEIIAFQREPYTPENLEDIESNLESGSPADFPKPFYSILDEASILVTIGPFEGANPNVARFAYTRTLVRLEGLATPIGSPRDHGCLQAELLHARSLVWHAKGETPKADHRPAAVLFDIYGQPFAYLKSLGEPNTAISWRQATFSTQAGAREVPANSLIRLVYDDSDEVQNEAGPAFAHPGLGLIAVRGGVGPLDVEFLRLANYRLPPIVRAGAFYAGTLEEPELASDRAAAEQLTGTKIKNLVFSLLKKSDVVTVAS